MKSELQKLVPKSDRVTSPAAPPETPCKDEPLALAEDGPPLPGKEAGVPAAQDPAGAALGHPRAVSDGRSAETEEGLAPPKPSALLGTEAEGGTAVRGGCTAPLLTDSSVFLDDDSNQPMPVSRFFGNVELMQVRLLGPPSPGTCVGRMWGPRHTDQGSQSLAVAEKAQRRPLRHLHAPRRVSATALGRGPWTASRVRAATRSRASAPVSPAMRVCRRPRRESAAVWGAALRSHVQRPGPT